MRIGFQHMGNLSIVLKALIENLGCDVTLGPRPNTNTITLGTRYAPEMVCLPFKVTLGDMFGCIQNGADTLAFIGGGDWSCRYGYYGRLQCSILKKNGFLFNTIFVGPRNVKSVIQTVLKINNMSWTISTKKALKAALFAYHKSKMIELTETLARRTRPQAQSPHEITKLEHECLQEIDRERTVKGLRKAKKRILNSFQGVKQNAKQDILRIMFVGESYCVIEPYVNFNLIEHLGLQQVYVEPFLTAHRWLFSHLLRKEENTYLSKKQAQKLARPYWFYGTGGEDQVGIGYALYAAQRKFDGIIHVMPFGCMPETAVLPVYEKISKTYGIPFVNFSLDEHSSAEGFYTRIEAYLDCLRLRRRKRRVA
jgi:predicted nucleotide-binding protein (sugar kinase/HSP70/actin superfamily)